MWRERRRRMFAYGDPQPITEFHRKNNELDILKANTRKLLGRFNALHCEYSEWFQRQHQSFVDVIKSYQVAMPYLVPQSINNIRDFTQLVDVAFSLVSHGATRLGGLDKLQKFVRFWNMFCQLHSELVNQVVKDIKNFCATVTALRHPEILDKIDMMVAALGRNFAESYDFRSAHNERDNLFTYRIMVADHRFLGLVGYIPFLTNYATKVCILISKVFLEKE